MRVAVVGSRSFPDLDLVREYVRSLPEGAIIVTGGARGVDKTAEEEAQKRGLIVEVYPAAWRKFGRYDPTAGFERNGTIVERADRLVAFHHEDSRGTADSIAKARARGIPVAVFGPRAAETKQEGPPEGAAGGNDG